MYQIVTYLPTNRNIMQETNTQGLGTFKYLNIWILTSCFPKFRQTSSFALWHNTPKPSHFYRNAFVTVYTRNLIYFIKFFTNNYTILNHFRRTPARYCFVTLQKCRSRCFCFESTLELARFFWTAKNYTKSLTLKLMRFIWFYRRSVDRNNLWERRTTYTMRVSLFCRYNGRKYECFVYITSWNVKE